jgi:hypothetical protein
MAEGVEQVAALPIPSAKSATSSSAQSGIQVGRMRVPLGVIGIIYEARPNVTADAAALCLKSGNAAILRGGSEAIRCNRAIAALVQEGLRAAGLPATAVQVVDTTDRAAVGELITMREFVDVIVPRGGKGLIERLLAEARVPMIKHLDGNCHVYVDDDADADKALRIVENAKTQRSAPATPPNRCWWRAASPGVAAASSAPCCRQGRRDARLRRIAGHRARRRHRRGEAKKDYRTGTRYLAPSSPSRWSPISTRPSPTSTSIPRSTPTPSSPRTTRGHALPARGRFGLGDGQRLDALRRRFRVRPRRRDRHLDRQDPRPRPGRPGRTDQPEVDRARQRRGALRKKRAVFKVYAMALYLPEKRRRCRSVLAAKGSEADFHQPAARPSAQQFVDALQEGMANNHSEAEMAGAQGPPEAVFRDPAGDRRSQVGTTVVIDWLPEKGTRLTVNGAGERQGDRRRGLLPGAAEDLAGQQAGAGRPQAGAARQGLLSCRSLPRVCLWSRQSPPK